MPNWCYNRVTAYGNEDKLKEIEKIFESKTPFNDIFPMPDWKNTPNENGELPVLHQEFNKNGDLFYETYNFPDGKNDDRWYHWCVENWDTKWEPDMHGIEYEDQKFWHLHLIPHGVHQRESQQNCVKSSQMFLFSVSLMNQDVKLQGIINGIM